MPHTSSSIRKGTKLSTAARCVSAIGLLTLTAVTATAVTAKELATPSQAAEQVRPRAVNEPFKFELYTANVLEWADGTRAGLIPDGKGAMAKGLDALVRSARESLDMALYGVQRQPWFLTSLERGRNEHRVEVRAVVDQVAGDLGDWSPGNFTYPDTVKLARMLDHENILPDLNRDGTARRASIMHNKFVVADRKSVWMGTANVTSTEVGSEYNANAAIIVHSKTLAGIFADEFSQMFVDRRFSRNKWERVDRAPLKYSDGTRVEVFFSPQDDAINSGVVPFIRRATRTLDIGMFFLTHDVIAEELIDAVNRGVRVRLIYDALAAAHPHTHHRFLRENGIDVRVENWGGKMHMKAAVADGRDVILGSLNWSVAGNEANDENTLIVRGNQRLASELGGYLESLWESLEPTSTDRSRNGGAVRDPRAESWGSINSCIDGIDNDHDGLIDAEDPACR